MANRTNALKGLLLAASAAASPVFGDVSVSIGIGIPVALPPPIIEVVSAPVVGYVWAPGYWAWHRDRYIWIRGRHIVERPGYYWVPERWEVRGGDWHFAGGHWKRDKHWHKNRRERAHRRDD